MGMTYGLTNSKLLWTHFMRQDEDVLKYKHFLHLQMLLIYFGSFS